MDKKPRRRKKDGHLPYRMVINKNKYYFLKPLDNNRHEAVPLGHVNEPDRSPQESLQAALERYRKLVDEVTGRESLELLLSQWMEKFAPLNPPPGTVPRYEPATVKKYRTMMRFINARIGRLRVNEIKHSDIARFLDDNFGEQPYSSNAYKSLLSNVFKWAVRRGMRETNPTRELEEAKEPPRTRYINDEELKWILQEASPMTACLVQLAAITGQRIGDLLTLEWSAVSDQSVLLPEFEDVGEMGSVGLVFYPSKTRKTTGRKVPVRLTEQLRDVLLKAKAIPTHPSKYVIRKDDGERYSYEGARSAFKRALVRAERAYLKDCIARKKAPREGIFEGIHFHDLKRRSLTDADIQNLNAQALGNHASDKTTKKHYLAEVEGAPLKLVDPPHMPF
ncbi:tyrosine-type recombinase/integrase [Paraburkholderia sp. BR10936]|uniref:tyrosine-type recombinase/integrase n=1 Tax=Paraburkholderia sp. BR10936 TaxID=3236993 RepID=UPI0034D2BD8D